MKSSTIESDLLNLTSIRHYIKAKVKWNNDYSW